MRLKTKYARIVWRMQGGRRRWFVQRIQEGMAPAKYTFPATGAIVGLDIGPSTVAIVAEGAVGLERFAPSVEQPWRETRRLQRALDRSRRANNPGCYRDDGTVKPGPKTWHRSVRYKKLSAQLAETERKLAAARKRDHGTLANKILGLGNVIQTETLNYPAFQKSFGRSVKVRAPGAFVQHLSRKAESAGGKLVELATHRLRMSQYDHVTGRCEKKPLSQRWHRLGGAEVWVQRDCYSAFLAKHAQGSEHNPSQLANGWAAAEPLLRRAGLCISQSASKPPSGSFTVNLAVRADRSSKKANPAVSARCPARPETPQDIAFRTPCL